MSLYIVWRCGSKSWNGVCSVCCADSAESAKQTAHTWVHYTTSCNTQSSAPEDGQNNCPKHVELTGIINKPLLLHIVGCLCYLYQWYTVKKISDNEIYLLIKYIKSVLWRVGKCLSYIEEARCLKVNPFFCPNSKNEITLLVSLVGMSSNYWGFEWKAVQSQIKTNNSH